MERTELLLLAQDIIDGAANAILSCVDGEGYPNTNAMLPVRLREGMNTFWFSSNISSRKVQSLRQNPKACLYFYDGARFTGVMLRGDMEVLQDPLSRQKIWRPGDELYYPQGLNDPDYCVLCLAAKDLRLYCDFTSHDLPLE